MSSVKTLIDNKVTALKNIFEIPPRSESMAGVIILYVFTNSVATSVWMFNAWSPFIFTLFNGSNVYVGLMSAINGFFELSCALVSGHVADTRWGPSKTLRHAVHFGLVTLCVVLLGVWSGKLWLLILAQCFEGTYMGFSFTCLESVFAQCLRRGERDRLYSVKFSCEAAGPIAGLILSAILYAVVGNSWNVKVLRWVMTAGIALHLGSMVTFLSHFEPLPWQRPLRHRTNSERTSNTLSGEQNNEISSNNINDNITDSNKLHHTQEDNSSVQMFDKGKVYTATDVIVLNSDANDNENSFNLKLVEKHQKELNKEVATVAKTKNSDNKTENNSLTTFKRSNSAHHPITREEDANAQIVMTPRYISYTATTNNTIEANFSYAVEEERVSALNVETGVRVNMNEQEVLPVDTDSEAHVAADAVLHTAELVNRARAAVWSACGNVVPPALIIAGAHAQSMCTAVERTSEEKAEDEAILRSSFVGVSSSHTINVSDNAITHECMERENHYVKSELNSHSFFSSSTTCQHEKATEMTIIPDASSSTVAMQMNYGCSINKNNNDKLREEYQQVTNAAELHVEQGEVLHSCNATIATEHGKASQSVINKATSHNISLAKDHNKQHDCEDGNCGHCFSYNNNGSNNKNTSMDVDASATNDVIHSHTSDITREKESCADHDEVYEIDLELQKARGVRRAIMKCIPLDWYPVIVVVCDLVLTLGSGMTTQYFALFMMKLYDVSPVVLSLLGLANSLLIAFLAIFNGFIGQRWGRVRAMLPLKVAGSFILLWMALARGTVYGPKFLMCIAYVLRNAFMNCSSGLSRALLMDLVPENKRGRWNAIESVQSAGWSGTAFLGGFLADSFGYGAAFIFTFFFHITACCMLLPLTARNDARLPVRVDAKKYHEIKTSHHINDTTKTDSKMREVKENEKV